MTPTCPICGERDADWLPYIQPAGKTWFCHGCDFVYSGTQAEAQHPGVREQRERWAAMRHAQDRHAEIGEKRHGRLRSLVTLTGRDRPKPNTPPKEKP